MGGSKTQVYDTTPAMTQDFRRMVQEYIMNPTGPGKAQAPGLPEKVNVLGAAPVSTTFNSGKDINRGDVRDVDSVDKLGGANSEFFKNMMAQLQPSFAQSRAEAAAAGKEASGSLTGTGLGNSIGSNLNRSLGQEQATLANYATQGIGMELSRQQANQGADMNFMQALLTRNQQGLQAQGMSSAAEQFNSGQTQQRNLTQAQLDANRFAMGYQGDLSTRQMNANNWIQLLGQQSSLGVGPNTVQVTPPWWQSVLGTAVQGAAAYAGAK